MNVFAIVDAAVSDLCMYDKALVQIKQIELFAAAIAYFSLQSISPLFRL